ncbi:hypothetical protein [Rhizobium leguminosarum]|nr:hypothetical protein [Rhizobium leguminosarum]
MAAGAGKIVARRRADVELILEMLAEREVITRDELREIGLVAR